MSIPEKLYKYRKFDTRTLGIFTDHGLYYSNPRVFNDPLDCRSIIKYDVNLDIIKEIINSMHDNKYESYKEWRNLFYPSDSELDLMAHAKLEIDKKINEEFSQYGVLCLSGTWKNILMWSHYSDEHRGVCIEFDTTEISHQNLTPVRYDRRPSIKASDIYLWKVRRDEAAKRRIFDAHFYSKAPDWQYEHEWRDISRDSKYCMAYRISSIYFGFRCENAVKIAAVKMFGVDSKVKFYDVRIEDGSFNLFEYEIKDFDRSEIDVMGMRDPVEILMKSAPIFDELA